jgi:aminopeptidase-like protein
MLSHHGLPRRQSGFDLHDADIGLEIYDLAAKIFPLCRSVTGNGVRETLARLGRSIPLEVREVPTGTPVFDWTAPREWNVTDAWIKDPTGRRIVDFAHSNLHVMSYSMPVDARLTLAELRPHLYSLPERPDAVPYRTCFGSEGWGFCLPDRVLRTLNNGVYDVRIETSLQDGHLTYGEFLHPGETSDEVLLTAHLCHPSLANDNCSGLALLTLLAANIAKLRTRLSYRILFVPGTLGTLAWLARNEGVLPRVKHGLVLSGVGDGGGPTYKKSRRGNTMIDRVMEHVLHHDAHEPGAKPQVLEFSPDGYEERQFCSPGFDLPIGLFQRSLHGSYPQYHTSEDDLDFIDPQHLASSYNMLASALGVLEHDRKLMNLMPKGEPQLARRGLYDTFLDEEELRQRSLALLWVLNLSDGQHTLLDIAARSKLPFHLLHTVARDLEERELLLALKASGR